MAEDLFNAISVGVAQKQAARFAPDLTESLATFANRGRVDQRQHLLDMPDNQCVEERFIGVLKVAKEGVFVEGRCLVLKGFQASLDLIVEVSDVRRQQTMQVEDVPFVIVESSSLVPAGGIYEVEAIERDDLGLHMLSSVLSAAGERKTRFEA